MFLTPGRHANVRDSESTNICLKPPPAPNEEDPGHSWQSGAEGGVDLLVHPGTTPESQHRHQDGNEQRYRFRSAEDISHLSNRAVVVEQELTGSLR